jgi:hypothetical protein
MASNKGTSTPFKVIMSFFVLVSIAMLFFAFKKDEKQPVDVTAKVVAKEVVSSRVVRDSVVSNDVEQTDTRSTTEKDLNKFGLTLKNSVGVSVKNK